MRWLLKRWWFWGGTAFMLVAVCAGYLLIPVGEGRISQANCDNVRLGMRGEQVIELLGDGQLRGMDQLIESLGADVDLIWETSWTDEDLNEIEVDFLNGRVTRKLFVPSSLSFLERMKRRIERRIRALWP
ncbi:MAG TPA: hypothetical protein VG099_20925 [Gemmataceae bacterium]|jgi:hypothetical protein|nr:hypothetical protein [Gemmataceae bacterium]